MDNNINVVNYLDFQLLKGHLVVILFVLLHSGRTLVDVDKTLFRTEILIICLFSNQTLDVLHNLVGIFAVILLGMFSHLLDPTSAGQCSIPNSNCQWFRSWLVLPGGRTEGHTPP